MKSRSEVASWHLTLRADRSWAQFGVCMGRLCQGAGRQAHLIGALSLEITHSRISVIVKEKQNGKNNFSNKMEIKVFVNIEVT